MSGQDTATPAFIAPDGLANDVVFRFALMVTDASNAASTADDVRILVEAKVSQPIVPDDNPPPTTPVNPTSTPTVNPTPTPVAANRTPTFGSAVVEDMTFTVGQRVETSPLPSARGGDGVLRYSLSPALPGGLRFDASSRAITGIATETLERTRFTYTATDSDGDSASLRFHITVVEQVVTVGTDDRGGVTPLLPPAIGYRQIPETTPTPIPLPKITWFLTPTATPSPQPVAAPTPTSTLAATATPTATPTDEAAPGDKGGSPALVWVIMMTALAFIALIGTAAIIGRRRLTVTR